jgi:hypothetical protein
VTGPGKTPSRRLLSQSLQPNHSTNLVTARAQIFSCNVLLSERI